jgi:HD-GYP domain-containing protein (c-di-GMP phosphodiesterase class II)
VSIPLDVPQLIREHHENGDGSGYPLGLNLLGQHPDTPILRLMDAFAALTANRPYRPAYSAFQAIKIIKDQNGPQNLIFDQRLLTRFVRLLAL